MDPFGQPTFGQRRNVTAKGGVTPSANRFRLIAIVSSLSFIGFVAASSLSWQYEILLQGERLGSIDVFATT